MLTGTLTSIPVTGKFRFEAYQFEIDALVASKIVINKISGIPLYQRLLNNDLILILLKVFNFFQLIMKTEISDNKDSGMITIIY